jgi:hypothetical protein
MASRKISLLALVFISTVLIAASLAAPTTAVEASAQTIPLPSAGFTQLQNGVWYRVDNIVVPNPLPNATGSAINDKIFLYEFPTLDGTHNALYGVRETTDWGLNATGTAYYHKVTLISDPDGSLSGTPRRVSGDEIVVSTTGILVNGTYQTRSQKTYTWYNVTGTSASPIFTQLSNTGVTDLRNRLWSDIVVNTLANGSLATSLYLLLGVSLLNNETHPTLESHNYAYFTWWIDQDFFPHFLRTANFADVDIMQIRHRLLGFVAFNDTNGNGVMDIRYRVVSGLAGPFRTLVSSEAMYVFKANFVHTVAGSTPTYNAVTGNVDWGMAMTGVNGTLAALRLGLSNIDTVIDQVGFDFHFNRTGNDAVVKVDEHIGTFSGVAGVPQYSYLSLATAYFSYFESISISRYHPVVDTSVGSAVNPEANSTVHVPKINMNATSGFAQVQIGGDNYVWGGDGLSHTAYSNIVPWFFFGAQFTTVGDYSVTGFSFGKLMYYYEACFPEWGGYSITHDPYFAVFGSSSPSEGISPIMFIVAGAGIGVLAAAVVLLVRRRRVAETGVVKTL